MRENWKAILENLERLTNNFEKFLHRNWSDVIYSKEKFQRSKKKIMFEQEEKEKKNEKFFRHFSPLPNKKNQNNFF